MIDKIKKDPQLSTLLRDECEENGVCIAFSESIHREDYVILNIDEYYRPIIHDRPSTPDCLVILKCGDGEYSLIVVELKKATKLRGFKVDKLAAKFETCLNDFIVNKFGEVLSVKFKKVQLLFISNIDLNRDKTFKFKSLISRSVRFQDANHPIIATQSDYKIEAC